MVELLLCLWRFKNDPCLTPGTKWMNWQDFVVGRKDTKLRSGCQITSELRGNLVHQLNWTRAEVYSSLGIFPLPAGRGRASEEGKSGMRGLSQPQVLGEGERGTVGAGPRADRIGDRRASEGAGRGRGRRGTRIGRCQRGRGGALAAMLRPRLPLPTVSSVISTCAAEVRLGLCRGPRSARTWVWGCTRDPRGLGGAGAGATGESCRRER